MYFVADIIHVHRNCHDDVMKWKHSPPYWPFVRGIHWPLVNSLHKGQWRGAMMFSMICVLIKWLRKQSFGWWFEKLSHPLYGIWSWVCRVTYQLHHVNGLVQDCSNSITNALELLKFCAKPSMCVCNWCQWYSPTKYRFEVVALRWRHNGHDCISNHQPHDCLLNHLFGRRSK